MKVMSGKTPKIRGCCHHVNVNLDDMNVNLDVMSGHFDKANDVEIVRQRLVSFPDFVKLI